MTSTNDKLRALFLTALMVVSVFGATVAFSGAVAAGANDVGLDGSRPDGSVLAAEEWNGNISIALSGTTNKSVSPHFTVYVNNTDVTDMYSVDGADDGTNGQITLVRGTSYRDLTPQDTILVNINNSSVGNITVTASGAHLGAPGSGHANSSRIFQGTTIAYVTDTGNDTEFDLTSGGDIIRNRKTGTNSSVFLVDTSDLDTGTVYWINETANNKATSFTLRNLGLSATADSTSIQGDETVTITASADYVGREVTIQLLNSDDEVVNESSATLDSDGEATATFNPASLGDFTGKVIDDNSGIEATTDTITVSAVPDADASFDKSVYEDNRGDVVEITLSVTEGETATVQLGTNSSGYNVTFDVTDQTSTGAAGDGSVTVLFNTSQTVNSGSAALFVKGSDSLTVTDDVKSGLTKPIAVGAYDLSVAAGGAESDVAQVNVQERSLDSSSSSIAPDKKSVTTRAGILKHATSASEVSTNDDLIVTIDVSGLEGTGVADNPLNATQNGLTLNVTETNPGQNTDAISLNGDSAHVNVIDDTANDTVYAVIDVSAAGFEKGDKVDVMFAIAGSGVTEGWASTNNLLSSGTTESVTSSFTVLEDKASFDSDPIVVRAAANQSITGTTTRAPGTNLTVTVRSSGNFLKSTTTVNVEEDGTWSTDFDFTGESEGTNFTASLSGFDVTVDGRISGPSTVTFADQSTAGSTVVVESVYLPAGGFVAIHEGDAGGPVIGSSKFLKSGTHTDVKITLDEPYEDPQTVTLVAMPHKDTDGDNTYEFPDADGPYTDNGSAVTDSASVTVDRSTPTPRVVTVVQDTPTPKVVEETREVTRVVEETRVVEKTVVVTQSPGQPGFGIAVAVVALLAAALLAVRRRD